MDPKQEHAILQKYRELVNECQQLMQKIAELEMDCHEHKLVEQTLVPLDPNRRAYRLVGDVLVERTVKEVLPSVTTNRENLENAINTLRERLNTKNKEVAEYQAKYSIRVQSEN